MRMTLRRRFGLSVGTHLCGGRGLPAGSEGRTLSGGWKSLLSPAPRRLSLREHSVPLAVRRGFANIQFAGIGAAGVPAVPLVVPADYPHRRFLSARKLLAERRAVGGW